MPLSTISRRAGYTTVSDECVGGPSRLDHAACTIWPCSKKGLPGCLYMYHACPIRCITDPIFFRFFPWVPFQCYTNLTEETALQVAERVPFEAKWRLLARVGVHCYILISNVSGAVKVAPLQILQFPVILPHKFQDAEKFNLQFPDFSEITETADKLRWLRYQKGLRQRDVADYAG